MSQSQAQNEAEQLGDSEQTRAYGYESLIRDAIDLDGCLILETDHSISLETSKQIRQHCEVISGKKVLVLGDGMKVARNYSKQISDMQSKLEIIAQTLDKLIAALAELENEDRPIRHDLDGNAIEQPEKGNGTL